jgi:hypothetical protein
MSRELNVPYMQMASSEWAKLTEEEKQPWQEEKERDSCRYRLESVEYWNKKHPPRG